MASLDTSSDKVNTRSSSAKRKVDLIISPTTLKNQKKKAAKRAAAARKKEMSEDANMDLDQDAPSSQEVEEAEQVLSSLTVDPVPKPPPPPLKIWTQLLLLI